MDQSKVIEYLLDIQSFEDRQGDLCQHTDYESYSGHRRVSAFISDTIKKIDTGEFE